MLSELLSPILNRQTQDPGSRAPRLGRWASSLGVVGSLEGRFVWTPFLFTNQYQVKPCRCSRRVASVIECIDLGYASNLMGVLISLTAPEKSIPVGNPIAAASCKVYAPAW